MDTLIAKYKQLKRASGDTTDATKDVLDSVEDSVDAYKKLAESIGLENDPEFTAMLTDLLNA
jgi:hypothetical protein